MQHRFVHTLSSIDGTRFMLSKSIMMANMELKSLKAKHKPSKWEDLHTVQPWIRALSRVKDYIVILSILVFLLFLILSPMLKPQPLTPADHNHDGYFDDFLGASECDVQISSIYSTPARSKAGFHHSNTFCGTRSDLLLAMSGGGRIGFDTPYFPRGCHYRWFDIQEICFMLDRFDGLVFVGDEQLQTIYSGLNILLRKDLVHGAVVAHGTTDNAVLQECRCNNQFIKQDCSQHFVADSQDLDDAIGSSYSCNRIKHVFLPITGVPDGSTLAKFKQAVPQAPRSQYRPIPIIHSLNPSTASASEAELSLKKIVEVADNSQRNTPVLWIGPPASGHIEIRGRKGNQEIWHFDQHMAEACAKLDVEVLGTWNLTVQANSWDGVRFGQRTAIVQAMMVLNWLSRVASS